MPFGILKIAPIPDLQAAMKRGLPTGHAIIAVKPPEIGCSYEEWLIEGPDMPAVECLDASPIALLCRTSKADGVVSVFMRWAHAPNVEWLAETQPVVAPSYIDSLNEEAMDDAIRGQTQILKKRLRDRSSSYRLRA